MRLELSAPLWGLALLMAATVTGSIVMSPGGADDSISGGAALSLDPNSTDSRLEESQSVAFYLPDAQPIFAPLAIDAALPAASEAPPEAEEEPSLRGVIIANGTMKAVFQLGRRGGEYVVAAVGDAVGPYRVVSIDPEGAQLGDETGLSLKYFSLIGAGEGP